MTNRGSRGSIEKLPYLVRTPTLVRERTPQQSPDYKELISPLVDIGTDTISGPRKSRPLILQREFTFTGYDIMADSEPKSKPKEESEAEKKLREHVECYISSCKHLGITPSTYLTRHINDKEIVMRSQPLGPKGTRALCISLVNNNRVEKLDLEDNDVGSEGAACIAHMMRENDTITEVHLAGNRILSKGTEAFIQLLKTGRYLHTLDISGSGLEDSDATVLANLIQTKSRLKVLNVSHNGIGEFGALDLGRAIAINDVIGELDLSWNHIRGKGALGIALGIKLGQNPLTPEVALTILRAIEDSNKCVLTALDLSDIVVRAEFLDKWDDIKGKRPLPLRIIFGPVMQATTVPTNEDEIIDWRDPVMRMFKFMHDKGYRIIDLLKRLDRDRSLSVDRQELKTGLLAEKIPMTEAQLDEVITRLDTDKDGEIDMGELINGEKNFRKKMQARTRRLLTSTKRTDMALLKLMQIEDL